MLLETIGTPLLLGILQGVPEWRATKLKKSKDFKLLQEVLRSQPKREMKFNSEFIQAKDIDMPEKLANFRTEALEYIFQQPLPLDAFFPKKTDKEILNKHGGGSAKHIKDLVALENEAALIENVL